MRYSTIDNRLFIENRKRFAGMMESSSVAVFNSNDILPTNADGQLRLIQNSDLFYLSGTEQEESILLLFPDAVDIKMREILFVREQDAINAIWEGHKLSKVEASKISGIETILWLKDFEKVFRGLVLEASQIYLNTNEHPRAVVETETRDARFLAWCRAHFPLHHYKRSAPILHHLRAIKSDIEVGFIKEACGITEKGFRRILGFIQPGVNEYEIEAELVHEFVRNRSMGFAYTPIIASGSNSCVLHYIDNDKVCKEGDVILLDIAAEFANYKSDMTRVVPVGGKFTPRQKDIYNAVLRVMRQAIMKLIPGNNMNDYQKEVGGLVEAELIRLGLITAEGVKKQNAESPLYLKYFMHGTSHHLGLDVHDYGKRSRKFEDGMVFTCEPGIYIPEEGIGVRLENNILISGKNPIDLMASIPLEVEEIEDLMQIGK